MLGYVEKSGYAVTAVTTKAIGMEPHMARIVAPLLPPPPVPSAANAGSILGDHADPRPDLIGDRARWGYLLDRALELDVEAAGPEPAVPEVTLHQMLYRLRVLGARIENVGDGWDLKPDGRLPDWRLLPGEIAPEQWSQICAEWLQPHADALQRLLTAPK